jgi:hypothetical protein
VRLLRRHLPLPLLLGPTSTFGHRLGQGAQLLTELRELRQPLVSLWHLPTVVNAEEASRTAEPNQDPGVAALAALPAMPSRLGRQSRRVGVVAGMIHA